MSCRHAHNLRGVNNQETTFCKLIGKYVAFPVCECSDYEDKSQPEQWRMEQIAWTIQSRNRGPVGFVGDRNTEIVIEPPKYPVLPGDTE